MKRFFIAAMALAVMVGCSKDDGASVLESSKKAVSITIANGVSGTRAVEAIAAFDTEDGGVGTIQDQATVAACADVKELVVLFANNAGTVEEAYSFANATKTEGSNPSEFTYRWHNVSESVKQVAVVRYNGYGTTAEEIKKYVGTNLSVYQKAAANVDEMENIDITAINLYVAEELSHKDGDECTITDTHTNKTWTYQLYTADVTITPTIARVEIIGIACDGSNSTVVGEDGSTSAPNELGATTLAAAKGENVSGGYDKLVLNTLKWGKDSEYTYSFADGTALTGIYGGTVEGQPTQVQRGDYTPAETVAEGETADDTADAIVWNIDPTAVVPQVTDGASPMVLNMTASAKDYTVVNTTKDLHIGFGDIVKTFESGNIYRLNINFGENNLETSNESICVEVKVTVSNWVVVDIDPVFGN